MPCKNHDNGMHRSLFIMQVLPATEASRVEHTCVCWTPQPPAHPGKFWVDANDWHALAKWEWNDNGTKVRSLEDA